LFWNVAGLGNKDKEFWGYVKSFKFVSLCEIYIYIYIYIYMGERKRMRRVKGEIARNT